MDMHAFLQEQGISLIFYFHYLNNTHTSTSYDSGASLKAR